ncbi:hypothetical protein GCM10010191_68990 [Actinomadura vinacea]|uniref:Uncharacterized protein n=1 Tax=Actinomadura vinacea TaxID=115336 RepID=A0ABN3JWY4_9ACTN
MSTQRRIAVLALAACAVLPLTGCVIEAGDGSSGTGSSTGSENPDTQGGQDTTVKAGALTMKLPSSWKARSEGDGRWHVVTRGSCGKSGYPQADTCPGFWIFGEEDISQGHEMGPYKVSSPYYPASDAQPCPNDPSSLQTMPSAPRKAGLAPVGSRKANYREWLFTCKDKTSQVSKDTFVQRTVYLPVSKLLIVDNWQTPGLLTNLQNATLA